MKSLRSMRRARGISLIEILISLAIGMVVVVAVIVSYLGSGQASRYHTALTQMNQDAQTGLNMLAREIQLAGYSAPAALSGANPSVISYYNLACPTGGCALPLLAATTGGTAGYIFGCDATKGTAPFTDATAAVLACQPAGATRSSGFGVVYEADVKNTVAVTVAATGLLTPTNCKGEALTVTTPAIGLPYYIARNRYYVDTQTGANTTGRPELYCASGGSNGVPFIENVDDMQVWYGLATATVTSAPASRQVVRYVQAGRDATTPGTVNATNAATPGEWEKVVAVRICLLMRSAEPVLTAEDSATYQPCDSNAAVATSADGYLRRAYYTTATLRSKMAY